MVSLLERMRESSKSMAERTLNAISSNGKRESEFYFPEINKNTDQASVQIRFLPSADPDDVPYVLYYDHFFRGDDGKWLVMDMCPTTVGQDCPICELNSKLWRTENPTLQTEVRKRSRKKHYVCNILVLNDPEHPEKNGKVFPYRFGAAVFSKLSDAIKPQFDGDPSFNPFDLWSGADFNLRLFRDTNKGKQISYEKCSFAAPSPLYGGDNEKLKAVVEQLIDLKKYTSPDNLVKNRRVTTEVIYEAYRKQLSNLDMSSIPSSVLPPDTGKQLPPKEVNDSIPWDDVSPSESSGDEDSDIREFFGNLNS